MHKCPFVSFLNNAFHRIIPIKMLEKILNKTEAQNAKEYLTLKTPRKPASENAVCLCRLLNILANFPNLFLHTGKQCGP